ncbi:MAG: carboxypeptidase regulatory-like domain-containing protein [Thermoplasmata archaeon]
MAEAKTIRQTISVTLILGGIFALAVFIRAYFAYDLALRDFLVSGGSDAFYYKRIIDYIVSTGKHLVRDEMLNYPFGMNNPRPPIYAWSVALIGILLGNVQGSLELGIWQSFLFSTAFWGALTIFPTYFLARDIFGRRVGFVAAFFLAILPAHIQRTPLSNGDHDALVLFFVVTAFYFFLRALGELKEKTWVDNWIRPTTVYRGLRQLIGENRRPVLLSIMSGTAIAVVALTWQGWAYAPVVVIAYFLVQLLVHKLRNQDPLGTLLCFTVALGTAHLLAAPYYIATGFVRTWFDVPLFLFAASVALGFLFAIFHRLPWMLVIPPIVLGFGAGLAIASLYSPAVAQTLTSGLGYFVRTKVYETIAEAQPPNLSQAILSFGAVTYYLSMVGIVWMAIQFVRRPRLHYLFALAWSAAAIFMAMSAVRFIFNASPAFAITSAWVTVLIVERLGLEQVRKAVVSTGGSKWVALKRGIKVRHVAGALFVALLLILPNTWYAVDAAIPFEKKQELDLEVYRSTPEPLRPQGYREGSLFYFGAFGYSLPLPNRYFPKAWEWLRQQDADIVPYWERPAFLSWWDYGFEAIQEGRHPTVADNFQNGLEFAGHFLAAQSENEAIAVLNIRLLHGDLTLNRGSFSAGVRQALADKGLDPDFVKDVLRRPAVYVPLIRSDPDRFGEWDVRLSSKNVRVIFLKTVLTETLDLDGQADLYRDLRSATGNSVLYFAVDSRLVPFSGTNTGIFYAPIKLTDHRTVELPDGRSIPVDFYRLVAETDRGEYDLEKVPPTARVINIRIEYKEMFYNSMLYRIFFGTRGQDVGKEDDGLPGISGQLQAEAPSQGRMLKHFKMVYRTAYFNPNPPDEAANRTEDWSAINLFDALELQQSIERGEAEGTVDISARASLQQGIVILKYYDGAILRGQVTTQAGRPLEGVRITVLDDLSIPHDVTFTDSKGFYEALLPFGEVRVVASVGDVDGATQTGRTVLGEKELTVSEDQAMNLPLDVDGDGRPDYLLEELFQIQGASLEGVAFLDLNGNTRKDMEEGTLEGLQVEVTDSKGGTVAATLTDADGFYRVTDLLPGTYNISLRRADAKVVETEVTITLGERRTQDLPVFVKQLAGRVVDELGGPAEGALIQLTEEATGVRIVTVANGKGNYTFEGLFEGNYTLEATLGERGSLPRRLRIVRGQNTTGDLEVEPMGELTGRSLLSFVPAPFVSFTLLRRGDGLAATVISDSSARFDVRLPEGTYDVYALHFERSRPYSFLGALQVGEGSVQTLELNLQPALRVHGSIVQEDGTGAGGAHITFEMSGAQTTLVSDNDGSFLVYLPPGPYNLWALSEEGQHVSSLLLETTTSLEVLLVSGTPVEGRVFYDKNRNATWDAGEGLEGVRIQLVDSSGRALSVITQEEGRYRVPLLKETSYRLSIDEAGFTPISLGPFTATEMAGVAIIELRPETLQVSGRLEGSVDLAGIGVLLDAIGDGATSVEVTTDAAGAFSAEVLPGLYRLVVDVREDGGGDGVRIQNLQEEILRVPVGKDVGPILIRVVRRVLVEGQIDVEGGPFEGALSFIGPEEASLNIQGEFATYLQPGNYTIYATAQLNFKKYALLEHRDLTSPANLSFTLDEAAVLSGGVKVGDSIVSNSIPLSFLRQDGARVELQTEVSGTYLAILSGGTYQVNLEWRGLDEVDGLRRFVRYTFSQEVTVQGGQPEQLDLTLSRSLDNATLVTEVLLSDQLVSATLTFEAANETAVSTTVKAPAGTSFEVSLAPGTYSIYAYRDTGKSVNLTMLEVVPYMSNEATLRLEAGYRVAGVVSLEDGTKETARIEFTSVASISFDSDGLGIFEAYLPKGQYQVTATSQRLERGMLVDYEFSGPLDIRESTLLNLQLARVTFQGVEVIWDPLERTSALPGEGAVYTLTLRNTGNVEDSFRLEGRPQDWGFDFDPPVVTLPFGESSETTVKLTITSPDDAEVAHEPLVIEAVSTSNASVMEFTQVELDILQIRGVVLRLSEEPPVLSPGALEYEVEVFNEGNGEDIYTLILTNPETLSIQGWRAKLLYKNQTSPDRTEDVAVPAREARSVTLRLETTGPVSASKVVLLAFSQDDRNVESYLEVKLSFPSLDIPIEDVSLEGKNVRLGPPEFPLILYAAIAAAAVLAAIILIRYRQKRWRR